MGQGALISAMIAGLVGGLHCFAMCGGYLAAVAVPPAAQPLVPARMLAIRQLVAHAGRLTTYAIGGAIAGGIGGAALSTEWTGVQRVLYALANALLLVLAVALARGRSPFAALEAGGLRLYRLVLPHVSRIVRSPRAASRFALGLLWGLTPCALVYGVLPLAMFAGSAADGALVMLAFGLGTLPNLALAGVSLGAFRRVLQRPGARRLAALVVAGFGVIGIYRVLFVTDVLAHGPFCIVP